MAAEWFGFGPPFFGGPQNVLSRQEGERLIKNDILGILLTLPGERVYRSEFGTEIGYLVFDQMDPDRLDRLREHVRERVEQYEERVTVNRVDVIPDYDNQTVVVAVNVSPNGQPLVNYLVEVRLNRSRSI